MAGGKAVAPIKPVKAPSRKTANGSTELKASGPAASVATGNKAFAAAVDRQKAASVSKQVTPKPTPGASAPNVTPQEGRTNPSDPNAPVPVTDDQGRVVRARSGPYAGQPMLRPAGAEFDPHNIVKDGDANSGTFRGFQNLIGNFGQGRKLDAQRAGGTFHPEYVDYSTVAIGLNAAAHGQPRDITLGIQNLYAAFKSNYGPNTPMDPVYTHLPKRNVDNTNLGYDLYESGQISQGNYTVSAEPDIKPLTPAPDPSSTVTSKA